MAMKVAMTYLDDYRDDYEDGDGDKEVRCAVGDDDEGSGHLPG